MESGTEQRAEGLRPYLSPMGAWAFALGTSIGWGSLVVTSNTYLMQAGPWGSVIGLLVGAAVMVVIARNYHYMINCFPDAGGAYTYSKEVFGHDSGFLAAWFLGLTYVAMFWANVTSLPLFAKYFLGNIFQVGLQYTVLGYDVYLGEAALSIVAILLAALFCMRFRRGAMYLMVGMGILITVGIAVCFVAAALGFGGGNGTFEPEFIPDKNALSQVLLIACISPWAFIGFENISHSAEEFAFSRSKVFRILVVAVLTAAALYVFVLLLSTMAYPPGYGSWFDYISDLGNLSGIEGLPAFYAAYTYLGNFGVGLLMLVLLSLIVTSLIGNIVALSRLLHALAKDSVLPKRFERVNKWGVPGNAVWLVAVASLVIPFLGRTAIGWIVDVTTIGAIIVYGFVSMSTSKVATSRGDVVERFTGIAGVFLMIVFGIYLLLPNLFLTRTLEPESYFLFVAWGILGFIFFRVLLGRDAGRRFGRSIIVWIGLLSLVLFVTFTWMNQAVTQEADDTMEQVVEHYVEDGEPTAQQLEDEHFVEQQLDELGEASTRIMLVAAVLFALAAAMLLTNFSYLSRWAKASEEELDLTRDIIYTDPLTGLPSMTRFHELAKVQAEEIFALGQRPAAIALDLVGMNDYNSNHGRDKGDRLLRSFADVLRAHFGDESCSRFAEDHFYALSSEVEVAEKIEQLFDDFKGANEGSTLPIRAGVYVCNADDDIVAVGFNRARSACDLDRKTWQSHISWFIDGMSDEARMRLHVLDCVDRAIEERWIRPYYQNIVDPRTGRTCSQEALARWIEPEQGALSPGQFIPILEEAGLLHKVDMHMVDCVLEDMAVKAAHGLPEVPVSVNISLRDLGQLDIASEIIKRVDDAGISHDLLRIEFTESAASDDPTLFKREVDELRSVGFEVWIDDFGSGYSSLNSLKDFDFDLVKLDMQFLSNERDEKSWDIVAGVVQITKSIGVRSLAEGVETEFQVQELTRLGCDMLQGFYYAKPQPLDEIIDALDDRDQA